MLSVIAPDTETTGTDLRHSCRPFFVTIAHGEDVTNWPWRVNPLTRQVEVDPSDLKAISQQLDDADEIVFQNAKFDVTALVMAGLKWKGYWWDKVHDTLYSGHLLASGRKHDLTSQGIEYLGIDIQPLEDALQAVVNECKRIIKSEYPNWRLAVEGDPGLPSRKGGTKKKKSGDDKAWKWDCWVGGAVAEIKSLPADHRYRTALPEYASGDSGTTLLLWDTHKRLLEERGLWKIYNERRKLIRIVYDMEARGVTYSDSRLYELMTKFTAESKVKTHSCISISKSMGHDLVLPKSGVNKSLVTFAEAKNGLDLWTLHNEQYRFDHAGGRSRDVLPKRGQPKSGQIPLNKAAIAGYLAQLEVIDPNGPKARFLRDLLDKRQCDTALGFGEAYRRYGIKMKVTDWVKLHPSLNVTGSNTLRFTCSNPNEQNISKQSYANIRYAFGPRPGREWWSLDYSNLELRLPAYEANETDMIHLFERPNDPPYFGSVHLMMFDILHPDLYAKHGVKVKEMFKDTWYQWTKNGDFAIQYGAQEISGTADAAYHIPGAQHRIQERLSNIAILSEEMVDFANRHGYVLTMEDKELGAYPLECTRTKWGRVKATVPLSYHVQGTAMWCMCRGMVRCDEYLKQISSSGFDPYITMQVHDELDFDFPVGDSPDTNLPAILELKALLEQSGDDIGVPLRVDVSYHPNNWSKAEEYGVAA